MGEVGQVGPVFRRRRRIDDGLLLGGLGGPDERGKSQGCQQHCAKTVPHAIPLQSEFVVRILRHTKEITRPKPCDAGGNRPIGRRRPPRSIPKGKWRRRSSPARGTSAAGFPNARYRGRQTNEKPTCLCRPGPEIRASPENKNLVRSWKRWRRRAAPPLSPPR